MTIGVPAATTTGELTLRPWGEQDIEPLIRAYQDPVLRRWTRVPVTDLHEARQWLELQKRGLDSMQRISFAVDETSWHFPGEAQLVANVVLKVSARHRGEVGFWTTAPGRGRGIAPRAVTALTDWAFHVFIGADLQQLELLHDVRNQASCRVAEKADYDFDRILSAPAPSSETGHVHIRRRTNR